MWMGKIAYLECLQCRGQQQPIPIVRLIASRLLVDTGQEEAHLGGMAVIERNMREGKSLTKIQWISVGKPGVQAPFETY